MKVKGGNVPVDKKLQTSYFVITAAVPKGSLPNNPPPDETEWAIVGYSSKGFDCSGTCTETYYVKHLIDGNSGTGDVGSFWLTPDSPTPSVTLDMGDIYTVTGVHIVGNPPPTEGYLERNPKVVRIQTSKDGNTWSNPQTFTLPTTMSVTEAKVRLPQPTEARYLRIVIAQTVVSDNGYTNVAEISAF
jgi:hypothetical protein